MRMPIGHTQRRKKIVRQRKNRREVAFALLNDGLNQLN